MDETINGTATIKSSVFESGDDVTGTATGTYYLWDSIPRWKRYGTTTFRIPNQNITLSGADASNYTISAFTNIDLVGVVVTAFLWIYKVMTSKN